MGFLSQPVPSLESGFVIRGQGQNIVVFLKAAELEILESGLEIGCLVAQFEPVLGNQVAYSNPAGFQASFDLLGMSSELSWSLN